MKQKNPGSILLIIAIGITVCGCSNPFRKKNQCEILCEQMHSECTQSCPTDSFDPGCHTKCDTFRNCLDTCDKPLFNDSTEPVKTDKTVK